MKKDVCFIIVEGCAPNFRRNLIVCKTKEIAENICFRDGFVYDNEEDVWCYDEYYRRIEMSEFYS